MAPYNLGRGADAAYFSYDQHMQSHNEVHDEVWDEDTRNEWFERVFIGTTDATGPKKLFPNGSMLPSGNLYSGTTLGTSKGLTTQ